MSPVITARGLTFAYPHGAPLFGDLSIDVERGSLLCITGRSGVGKSTLLYCLGGVLECAGEVHLDGVLLSASASQRAAVRLKTCGFVFQRGELLPELTVVENVALPLRLAGTGRRPAREMAMIALEQFGMEACAEQLPQEISGGQAQRASVARALIHGPAVVLADEPTSSLDAASRDDVIAVLRSAAAQGAAVVCATHDPALMSAADAHLEMTGEPVAERIDA